MRVEGNQIYNLYPWQQLQWDTVLQAISENRLPHALLISGPPGVGKLHFALFLAQYLLCLEPKDNSACGHCQACTLFRALTHPDLQVIQPEEEGKVLKVDQIREMIERNSLTPHLSKVKLHLIVDADMMNTAASNSVLKTLEEPSPNSIIILVTSRPERLTATIRSRCQNLSFSAPESEQAISWLNAQNLQSDPKRLLSMAQNAPLTALAYDEKALAGLRDEVFNDFGRMIFGKKDPVALASQWQEHDLAILFNWLTVWVIDLIRLKYENNASIIENSDKYKGLWKIASAFSLNQLFDVYKRQLEAGRLLTTQANKQLLLESLLIPWTTTRTE